MEVNGKPCILHARAQAAFASILIPGLPEPYRKSEPKECCVLFFDATGKADARNQVSDLNYLLKWHFGK